MHFVDKAGKIPDQMGPNISKIMSTSDYGLTAH